MTDEWTCPYITSLDKPCGRTPERLGEQYCDMHSVIVQLETLDFDGDQTTIVVPESVRPMVDRILSDFTANLDVKPWRWAENPVAWINWTPASMRRNEALRPMNGDDL